MAKVLTLTLLTTAALTAPLIARAADIPVKAVPPVPPIVSAWELETGFRYWYSSGRYDKRLFNVSVPGLVSRLTYDDLTGHAAEGFWRLNHSSGLFAKGIFGGGSIVGGHMNDQDFPPFIVPQSNTLQEQRDGSLQYASVDLGYSFWRDPRFQVGAFVGYQYWHERLNTFGCQQVAANPVCASLFPTPIGPTIAPLPTTTNSLDNDATWNSLRVGLNGDFAIGWDSKISADVAYVRSQLDATDFHNLRPDIRGIREDGTGNGFMADLILTHQITNALNVGIGGRWWHIETDGNSHFEQTAAGGFAQPIKVEQDRFGGFVQASYKWGEPLAGPVGGVAVYKAPPAPPFSWTGFYVGANVGYGFGNTHVTFDGITPLGTSASSLGFVPNLLAVDTAGFLGGGQIGYNWQSGRTVAGVEADLDYAHIGGSTGITPAVFPFTTTADKNISWLSTVRGRLGTVVADNLLLYGTGGAAFAGTRLSVSVRDTFLLLNCPFNFVCAVGSTDKTSTGWTAGAGFEYAVTPNVTFKGEYLYVGLGSETATTTDTGGFALAGLPVNFRSSTSFNTSVVRLGVNYKFDWAWAPNM